MITSHKVAKDFGNYHYQEDKRLVINDGGYRTKYWIDEDEYNELLSKVRKFAEERKLKLKVIYQFCTEKAIFERVRQLGFSKFEVKRESLKSRLEMSKYKRSSECCRQKKMIVNGLLYDTSKAEVISEFENVSNRVYDWWLGIEYRIHQHEVLYRTEKSRYFILKCVEALGECDEVIKPLTEDEAFDWLIKHDPDRAGEVFPRKQIEEA